MPVSMLIEGELLGANVPYHPRSFRIEFGIDVGGAIHDNSAATPVRTLELAGGLLKSFVVEWWYAGPIR